MGKLARVYLPKPRRRERGSSAVGSVTNDDHNITLNTHSITTSAARPEYINLEVISDVTNPRFQSRSSNGEIINSPMSKSFVLAQNPQGVWTLNYQTTGPVHVHAVAISGTDMFNWAQPPYSDVDWRYSASASPPDLPSSKSDAALLDIATIAAKANVIKPDALALVTAAELGKTVSMVTSNTTSLKNALALLAQGRPKKAVLMALGVTKQRGSSNWRRGSKTAASRWLEIRYGWLPLIYDVQGVINAYNAVAKPRFTARGYANDLADHTATGVATLAPQLKFNFTFRREVEKRYRAYILYEVDQRTFLTQKLGLLQLPLTAWELVPWSFVIDWFVNIGDWCESISPQVGVNILATGYTVAKTYTAQHTVNSATLLAPYVSAVGLAGNSDFYLARTKSRVPKLPPFPMPRVNVKFNPKRAVDSIALLVQQSSKAFRR
jgi:hypothetical protein